MMNANLRARRLLAAFAALVAVVAAHNVEAAAVDRFRRECVLAAF